MKVSIANRMQNYGENNLFEAYYRCYKSICLKSKEEKLSERERESENSKSKMSSYVR